MAAKEASIRVIERPQGGSDATSTAVGVPIPVVLSSIAEDGLLRVRTALGEEFDCEWLQTAANAGILLHAGDRLLAIRPAADTLGCVLGRIGRYARDIPATVTIEAAETLT